MTDAENFAAYVGEQLAWYAGGEGDMAHDVLDSIQREFTKTWAIPEVGDDD